MMNTMLRAVLAADGEYSTVQIGTRPATGTGDGPFVVVLGMHRSGTSLCAHVLKSIGIPMGDERDAKPSNPKGQWERLRIVQYHDRILTLLNRSYYSPLHDLPLPTAWWTNSQVLEIKSEI